MDSLLLESELEASAAEEYQLFDDATLPTIICCVCGISIEPNPTSMCLSCLKSQVNITESVPKQNQVQWCRFCGRYLQPPNAWLEAELESRELLAICLKRIKGFGGRDEPRLVDAGFTWTEPHSRRLKVWLTLQAEVMGSILQQKCSVEFLVLHQMCSECQRAETHSTWRATVQLRQRAEHKKTLLYLEQLLLRLQPHKRVSCVKQSPDGMDFFFMQQDQARKLVDFFLEAVPCRYKFSKELVSHDTHNNTYDYKLAFAVEVVPVCRGDVVFIPKALSRSLGNITQGPLLCYKVAQVLHLIDPLSLQTCEVSSTQYWRHQFPVLSSPRSLLHYLVLETDPDTRGNARHSKGAGPHPPFLLSDVWLLRLQEGQQEQEQVHTRTHLGHLLKPGDSAMGFDLSTCNVNLGAELQREWERQTVGLPDIILLKKSYGDSGKRARRRNWHLRRLGEMQTEAPEAGLEEFMQELEEDKDMRQNVNIYKKPYAKRHRKKAPVSMEVGDVIAAAGDSAGEDANGEDDAPVIGLEEMLEDLSLEPVS